MVDKLLLKIRERYKFSASEEAMLRSMMHETKEFDRDSIIVAQEKKVGFSSLLLEGLACRATDLASGERQIMEINVPGDFVDLHSYPLEWLDHNVTALTRCKIAKLPHENISEMIQQDPRIGRIFWFATMVDASIHREWLVTLGRRSAAARIAHLFCEMYYRLRVVGLVEDCSFNFPLRQADLANALGLTSVHINRKLRELREANLCTFRDGQVKIHKLRDLERVAEFDPKYLFLEPRTA